MTGIIVVKALETGSRKTRRLSRQAIIEQDAAELATSGGCEPGRDLTRRDVKAWSDGAASTFLGIAGDNSPRRPHHQTRQALIHPAINSANKVESD